MTKFFAILFFTTTILFSCGNLTTANKNASLSIHLPMEELEKNGAREILPREVANGILFIAKITLNADGVQFNQEEQGTFTHISAKKFVFKNLEINSKIQASVEICKEDRTKMWCGESQAIKLKPGKNNLTIPLERIGQIIITITLNLDGGAGKETLTGNFGGIVEIPANPKKDKSIFAGWNPPLPTKFMEDTIHTAMWINEIELTTSNAQSVLDCDPQTATEIIVPENVVTLPTGLFQNNKNLVSVKLPSTLKTIKRNAFRNCTNLTSITIPKNVTKIEQEAFSGCTNLKTAHFEDQTFPEGWKSWSYMKDTQIDGQTTNIWDDTIQINYIDDETNAKNFTKTTRAERDQDWLEFKNCTSYSGTHSRSFNTTYNYYMEKK